MAKNDSRRRRAQAGSRTFAVALSLLANSVFLAVLALGGRVQSDSDSDRPIGLQLTLVHPAARPEPAETSATSKADDHVRRALTPFESTAPPAVLSPTTSPAAPAVSAAAPGLASALRRHIGCEDADFVQLRPEERQYCRDRLAAATDRALETASLGVAPGKRAIFDLAARRDHLLQEPFLAEKPKNGCRPRVAADNPATSAPNPQGVTFGVSCGVQF